MDSHMFDGLMEGLIFFGVIIGIAVALLIGGLVYGGCKLHEKYSIKIEKKAPITQVVTITNYVTVTNK